MKDFEDSRAASVEASKNAGQTEGEALDRLMAAGAPAAGAETPAVAAEGEESSPVSREAETTAGAAPIFRRAARSGARLDVVLQVALAINVVVLAVLLGTTSSTGVTESAPPPAQSDPVLTPLREIGQLPDSPLWEQAVRAAGTGDYAGAVRLLESYLEATPQMSDVERQLVYNQVAYYLIKVGRVAESQRYTDRARELLGRVYLGQDLLQAAEAAGGRGALEQMRASYARFLLQLEQTSPAVRQREAEALLRLGDSYRIEAGGRDDKAGGEGG